MSLQNNWRHSQWYLGLKRKCSSMPFIGSTEGAIYGTVGCLAILAILALCSPIIVVVLILIF